MLGTHPTAEKLRILLVVPLFPINQTEESIIDLPTSNAEIVLAHNFVTCFKQIHRNQQSPHQISKSIYII